MEIASAGLLPSFSEGQHYRVLYRPPRLPVSTAPRTSLSVLQTSPPGSAPLFPRPNSLYLPLNKHSRPPNRLVPSLFLVLHVGLFRRACSTAAPAYLKWAEAKLGSSFLIPFHTFVEELRKIFDHPARSKNAADRLLSLRQGFRSVADFSVEFRVLATEAQWDDAALRTVFRHGLSDPVKNELTHRDPPDSLDELIELAIRLDNRIRERRRERGQIPASVPKGLRTPPLKSLVSPVSSASASSELPAEPMELARAGLSPTERQHRLQAGECIYCGSTRHFIAQCPSRPKGGARQGDWGP
ncbi:hypothetical protein Q8A73_012897 [Channa argus]|nr:hypothetical protein Q8A73_012897 [Channa argus]